MIKSFTGCFHGTKEGEKNLKQKRKEKMLIAFNSWSQ